MVMVGWGSGSKWCVWWWCRRRDTVWKMGELEGFGVVVYVDAEGGCLLVSDDDGVTEDWFWRFGRVFRGVLGW